MPNVTDDYKRVHPPTRTALRQWLATNAADSPGVWVVMWKKESGRTGPSYVDIVEEALCVGWIDGQKGAVDESWFKQRFTPRTRRSPWSQINCERVGKLTAAGRMQPAGLAAVDAAKADGRWDSAYAGQRTITVPDDLAAALAQDPVAEAFFATLSSVNRYAILYRIGAVKKADTRARKIATFVAMLREHRTLH